MLRVSLRVTAFCILPLPYVRLGITAKEVEVYQWALFVPLQPLWGFTGNIRSSS